MIPLGFPRRTRWSIVASLAALFSLLAIVALTGHESKWQPPHRHEFGRHPIEVPTPLTRLVSPSDIQRNWESYQYGICGQLCWQNGLFQLAQKLLPTWANWTRQLHSNVEATRTHLAGEIGPR